MQDKMEKAIKSHYPDISKILSAKATRRKALSALSWEEKVSIIVQMQKSLPKGKWKDSDSDSEIACEMVETIKGTTP